MVSALVLGLLFLGGGGVSARALWRSSREPTRARSRRVLQGAARSLVLFAFGALFVVVGFDVHSGAIVGGLSLLLIGALVIWFVCDGVDRFIDRREAESLTGAVRQIVDERSAVLRGQGKRLAVVVIPRDWSEIDLRRLAPDALLSFRSFLSAYALCALLVPILAALAMVAMVHFGGTTDVAAVSAWVSLNAFLVASCLASAVMATVMVVALLHVIRVLRITVAYRKVLTTLATVIGVTSALGALTGAMLPVVATLPYLDEMFPATAVAELTSSSVLLEMSAGGAVVGFAGGIVVALNELLSSAENFVLRRIAVPALFLVMLGLALGAGASPSRMAERILHRHRSLDGATLVDCESPIPGELLADHGRLLVAVDQCGGLHLLSDGWVFGLASAICAVMVVVGVRRDLRATAPVGA